MSEAIAALVAPLRAAPERSLLAFDFDGTLSAVVDDPAAAVPVAGVVERLADLAGAYRRVAVLSGRPVAFLAGHLPSDLALSGLYGLEHLIGGERTDHPAAARWRSVVSDAAAAAGAAAAPGGPLEGVIVEPKGLSLTLHCRTRPDLEPALGVFAGELGARLGLEVRPAKRSVELHPPIDADKGTALRALVGDGVRAVLVVGDDVGDVAAFDEAARLEAAGVLDVAVRIAVGGPELPDAVRERAQLVLDGPPSVLVLLDALVDGMVDGPGDGPASPDGGRPVHS